ncbi:metalloregulator ArsR/SmtB family transcription factor [Bacillus cereus]|uniref:Winged helix-turn-helix transcriptional regulator n=2 Tax=Bacillus cereus group TaxID=86661 RepID=A0A643LWJ6_BACTU|nr:MULTISPECIES: metalloregulator ArsR/SmtB family transcription factor [Bacillus cereus group]AGE79903.1 ArsR family transcriptional regulator [Bacillus thuringiensis serovar kurstaki str. HD73]AHZ52881.1 ArsR family transcriptional regulator [Bacillus thuringiensis serovar kurstaki str. YBT-1520]AIE35306.1 ArsR family transcriptional regulator [Bacillus thuringiensis serovar kurstaki str. HD-1]AJK40817.1 bacterial regulatory, arsR family protein [Bacillus thuringiensis serovar kurstaki]AKJ60
MSKKTIGILRECTPIFSILQDLNRQDILVLLYDEGEMSVNQIVDRLSLSRPAISHHLKHLLNANLVTVQKRATERYYALSLDNSIVLLKQLIESLETDNQLKK